MSSEDRFYRPSAPAGEGDGESLPAVESPAEQVASLAARLEEVEAEKRDLDERHLRAMAEMENFKKRMRRDQAESLRYAAEPLVRDLLPVVDNLERAVAHAEAQGGALVDGVSLVLKSLHDVLKQHGVQTIEARVGDPFDPARHEAVDRREDPGEPNRVLEQWQRGYQIHDRLLRPSCVVVSGRSVAKGGDRD